MHLEVVFDLSCGTFIKCLKHFVSRRELPSDNGKTFQGAAKVIKRIKEDPEVTRHSLGVGLRWQLT